MSAPTCVSCTHFRQTDDARCGHPLFAYDPVSGGVTLRLCSHMRAQDGACGPEGARWEGKGIQDPPRPEPLQHDPAPVQTTVAQV